MKDEHAAILLELTAKLSNLVVSHAGAAEGYAQAQKKSLAEMSTVLGELHMALVTILKSK